MGFIISLLLEEPQLWDHHLLEKEDSVLATTAAYFKAMVQLYNDPQCASTVEDDLHALVLGKRPMEDFKADFCKWAAETDWKVSALRFQLSGSLKDELAQDGNPGT